MKKIVAHILFLLVICFALPVPAQRIYSGQIKVPGELKEVGDSIVLDLSVDINDLYINTNRFLTITPILTNGMSSVEYPPILINGTTRHKAYQRAVALGHIEEYEPVPGAVIQSKNKVLAPAPYHYSVAYQDWMQDAYLEVREVLCGCGGEREMITHERLFDKILLEPRAYNFLPGLSYLQPQAEPVKNRSERYEVYLNFPVGKTVIQREFGNNQSELNKLESAINTLKNDANLTVTRVNIAGYASPEGSVALNDRLSEGRAQALKTLLTGSIDLPASVYHVTHGGEDWTKLTELVEQSNLAHKDEILTIIRTTPDATQRQSKLVALDRGVPYKQLLNEFYPQLRRVICEVSYSVKNFTVEEGKEILRTKPQQLSLNEMFLIANTYDTGTKEFTDVFDTAVRLFPDDPVANLNAAASSLSRNDVIRAREYLQKADSGSPAYANNMGVLYMLQGDYANAVAEFNKAIAGGSREAQRKLDEINRKIFIMSF